MEGLEKYKSIIKSLSALVEKMENGTLSITELSDLEGLTRDLHERSIILKYKAFEEKVGVASVVEVKEEISEESSEQVEEESEEPEEEDNELEFSLFEDTSSTEDVMEEILEKKEEEIEAIVEVKIEEPIVETPIIEPVVETLKEEVNLSEPIKPEDEQQGNFLDRLKTLPSSVSSQFTESKIESLNGAFGLNERLRYIRELFDGSNDLFAEAISSLDSQSSLGEASIKVEELAFSNSWDLEEEAVLEFMSLIKRRYA